MGTAIDGKGFSNISASTAAFNLIGGAYGVSVVATFGGGSVKLQRLALDGSTFVSLAAATDFTANGGALVNLPAGSYRFTIATATAVYAEVQGVSSH
jgi:hypothetical protein